MNDIFEEKIKKLIELADKDKMFNYYRIGLNTSLRLYKRLKKEGKI